MVKSTILAIVFQTLIVAVHSFTINYSTPQQCGDVEISWTKPSRSAAQLQFPLLLYILPFDSTAVSQQIPGWNASMTSGSTVVNFVPNLSSGTEFLLAVTDQTGKGVGRVSDVKNVTTSQDTSCLSTNTPSPPGHFQTFTTPSPSDCPSLTVTWDGSVKSPRPTILGFTPGESPVNMNPPSSPLPVERSILIKGTFTSMSRIVVLFRDDSSEPSRTSQFLTVGGMEQDGCSTLPSASPSLIDQKTLPPCDLRCSNKIAGRVIGGALAGAFSFAFLLFAIFLYCRRRHRAAHGPPPASEEVSSTKSKVLPSPPSETAISNSSRPISSSIALTSTKFEGPSDENEQQQGQKQENENNNENENENDNENDNENENEDKSDIATTASSIILSYCSPLPLPTSPLTRRRSWADRSTTTEESVFLQLTESSIFRLSFPSETGGVSLPSPHDGVEGGSAVSRPDSPTIPESKSGSLHSSARAVGLGLGLPSTPRTPRAPKISKPAARPRSQRSQRSERREEYLKLDPASDITVTAGEVRSSRSSRSSRKAP